MTDRLTEDIIHALSTADPDDTIGSIKVLGSVSPMYLAEAVAEWCRRQEKANSTEAEIRADERERIAQLIERDHLPGSYPYTMAKRIREDAIPKSRPVDAVRAEVDVVRARNVELAIECARLRAELQARDREIEPPRIEPDCRACGTGNSLCNLHARFVDDRITRILTRRNELPLPGWYAVDLASSGYPSIVYKRPNDTKVYSFEEMTAIAEKEPST